MQYCSSAFIYTYAHVYVYVYVLLYIYIFSYKILKWQTDDEQAQAARTFKGDKMRSQGPTRDRIETFILTKRS